MTTGPTAEYFDAWYADMPASPRKDEIQQRHLGLPPELLSTSLLGWDGLGEVAAALELQPGQTLLDLACGRGGYGLEIARRTGAELIGVDFSVEAIRQATAYAATLGRGAQFLIGDLGRTGLPDHAVEAVLCVDAIQFATSPSAAYREIFRVLKPGSRVVLTCWEVTSMAGDDVPDRLRSVDLTAGLSEAGFRKIQVLERPGWRAAEQAMWREAAALDPGEDPALRSFHAEAVRSLEMFESLRRVLAIGER